MSWGYDEHNGPDRWADLDPANHICRDGRNQSPVDVTGAVPGEAPEIEITGKPLDIVLHHLGNMVVAGVNAGVNLTRDGRTYELQQFHLHVPSEHWVDGWRAAAELHLVFEDEGELTVVGVLLDVAADDSDNEALAPLLARWPLRPDGRRKLDEPFDVSTLLPPLTPRFELDGSLTTPPCTEGVSWIVLETRAVISEAQLERILSAHPENARPPQPLHDRTITSVG